ncbi:hypothetical protein CAEBREN_31230 [Caenorhabditis brenneri]|uniref:Uncharacterized protein n=1 Tax=Caenorhabditis brenneri TaxID=135651 RepID=G0PH81_CAEBE|nr:hypothetical protein CAEBREN_31230 [Caenorhabditis brenneri]
MSVPSAFLILLWFSIAGSLPLAPAPPDFNADFSKRDVQTDLMPVVGEDELQSLRHNGFKEQLHHLRQKNIGRNTAIVTEEMARIRNSIEDISEFSLDSNEVDEAINDITVPMMSPCQREHKSQFLQLQWVDRTGTTSQVPIQITTTTLPPPTATTTVSTTRYSPPFTTRPYLPLHTESPHIFSSSTVRLPSAIPISTSTTLSSHLPEIVMTTPRPYRGGIFTTEFTIEPVQKRSEGRTSLRERIRSTSQLLNLLGDKIAGIDQNAVTNGAEPKTGVLTNIYDRGEIKKRNYRTKQWGVSGEGRQGIQTYDGQFSGVAYGSTKQRGGGYTMRKKMGKRPWSSRGYKTRRLGDKRPEYMRPSTFIEKKTTDFTVEPYGSKRRGEWIRGVKVSERRNAVRKVSDSQKSFAQALLESEEASMKQLKKTLRQIREVVKIKTSSTSAVTTTTSRPVKLRKNRVDSEYFNGAFDLRRL